MFLKSNFLRIWEQNTKFYGSMFAQGKIYNLLQEVWKKTDTCKLGKLNEPTDDVIEHKRTHSQFLYKGFFPTINSVWNSLLTKLKTKNAVLETCKTYNQKIFVWAIGKRKWEYGKNIGKMTVLYECISLLFPYCLKSLVFVVPIVCAF